MGMGSDLWIGVVGVHGVERSYDGREVGAVTESGLETDGDWDSGREEEPGAEAHAERDGC